MLLLLLFYVRRLHCKLDWYMQYFINVVCTICLTVLPSLKTDIILSYTKSKQIRTRVYIYWWFEDFESPKEFKTHGLICIFWWSHNQSNSCMYRYTVNLHGGLPFIHIQHAHNLETISYWYNLLSTYITTQLYTFLKNLQYTNAQNLKQ